MFVRRLDVKACARVPSSPTEVANLLGWHFWQGGYVPKKRGGTTAWWPRSLCICMSDKQQRGDRSTSCCKKFQLSQRIQDLEQLLPYQTALSSTARNHSSNIPVPRQRNRHATENRQT